MAPIELTVRVTVDEANIRTIVNIVRQSLQLGGGFDEKREARLKASRNAIFAGQKPPENRGLLIDTKEVSDLFGVSPRTIYRMEVEGEMPKAIRIGKAVRWGYEEIHTWVNSGCPRVEEWAKRWQAVTVHLKTGSSLFLVNASECCRVQNCRMFIPGCHARRTLLASHFCAHPLLVAEWQISTL